MSQGIGAPCRGLAIFFGVVLVERGTECRCGDRRWGGNEKETCGRYSAGSKTHAELEVIPFTPLPVQVHLRLNSSPTNTPTNTPTLYEHTDQYTHPNTPTPTPTSAFTPTPTFTPTTPPASNLLTGCLYLWRRWNRVKSEIKWQNLAPLPRPTSSATTMKWASDGRVTKYYYAGAVTCWWCNNIKCLRAPHWPISFRINWAVPALQ